MGLRRIERYGWRAAMGLKRVRPESGNDSMPSGFEWIVAVFAVTLQMGAFVSLDQIVSGGSLRGGVREPLNTAGIAISAAAIGIVCLPRMRQLGLLASRNLFSVLFMVIVLLSALWSIHPDLTIRRGAGYVLTMVIAGHLTVRFKMVDSLKVLSWGFAIAAIGSLLFVAAFPQYGIMGGPDLVGDWRGVFPHKNVLGPVMAVAVFTELYLLVLGDGRPRWRLALLGTYLALVVLSHSATALLLSGLYLAGTWVYLLWMRNRLAGVLASTLGVLLLSMVLIVLWDEPGRVLGFMGKDLTLTGRTTLWSVVFGFIGERPVLGWGYRAMWQPEDLTTTLADKLTGGWGVPSSHNAFLEITLQLGLLGVALLVLIIGIALWRSCRSCYRGNLPLGWFSLMFFVGVVFAAQTMETLGQNQVIDWVVFNVLAFSCGLTLSPDRESALPDARRRFTPRRRTLRVIREGVSQADFEVAEEARHRGH